MSILANGGRHVNAADGEEPGLTFVASKLLWIVAKPSNLLFFMLVVGFWRRGSGWGRWLLGGAIALIFAIALLPIGLWMTTILEERYPRPQTLPDDVAGIIVLGGSQSPDVSAARGALALSGEAERQIEGLALALRYPEAKLVFSGHSAAIFDDGLSEVQVNEMYLDLMQFPRSRVVMENRSRNTFENAFYSRELLAPQPDENWIVVTSAAHMPRAMGIFDKLGWQVIPWPVDFKTTGAIGLAGDLAIGGQLAGLDRVMREYIGLAAYYVMGRTDRLLPGAR